MSPPQSGTPRDSHYLGAVAGILTGSYRRHLAAPPPLSGQEEDTAGQLEAVGQHVDEEGGEEDDVAPAALGVVVLSDGGGLHLLLPPLPGGGGGH